MSNEGTRHSPQPPRTAALRGQIIPSTLAIAALAILAWAVLVPRTPIGTAHAAGTNTQTESTDRLSDEQLDAIAARVSERIAADVDRRIDEAMSRAVSRAMSRIARTDTQTPTALRERTDRALARLENAAAAALDSVIAATEPVPALGPPLLIATPEAPAASTVAAAPAQAPAAQPATTNTPDSTPDETESTTPDRSEQSPAPTTTNRDASAARTINVNTATPAQLELLPGIGPALASRIIESRRSQGPFRRLDDLQRVRGIGPKTAEAIAQHVRFE